MMSDPRNFSFIGSIPVGMLERVPLDNVVMRQYRKLPSSGVCPIHAELRKLIDESNKLKHGGKRKAKVAPSESIKVTKKNKKSSKETEISIPAISRRIRIKNYY